MDYITSTLGNLLHQTAFFNLTWGNYLMIAVACFFLYLAIRHGFEPLLLLPIAFGMLLVNIYPDIILHAEDSNNGVGGLLYYFYILDDVCKTMAQMKNSKTGEENKSALHYAQKFDQLYKLLEKRVGNSAPAQ